MTSAFSNWACCCACAEQQDATETEVTRNKMRGALLAMVRARSETRQTSIPIRRWKKQPRGNRGGAEIEESSGFRRCVNSGALTPFSPNPFPCFFFLVLPAARCTFPSALFALHFSLALGTFHFSPCTFHFALFTLYLSPLSYGIFHPLRCHDFSSIDTLPMTTCISALIGTAAASSLSHPLNSPVSPYRPS